MVTTAMGVFSLYLLSLLKFKIGYPCPWCLTSVSALVLRQVAPLPVVFAGLSMSNARGVVCGVRCTRRDRHGMYVLRRPEGAASKTPPTQSAFLDSSARNVCVLIPSKHIPRMYVQRNSFLSLLMQSALSLVVVVVLPCLVCAWQAGLSLSMCAVAWMRRAVPEKTKAAVMGACTTLITAFACLTIFVVTETALDIRQVCLCGTRHSTAARGPWS